MTVNFNNKIIDGWWSLLKHLSKEAKLELATRLINSAKRSDPEKKNESWMKLYGAWKGSPESADELISIIKDSRQATRQIEPFD